MLYYCCIFLVSFLNRNEIHTYQKKKKREKRIQNPMIMFCLLSSVLSYSHGAANTGLYAHYVFKTLDSDHSGIVSFEVSDTHFLGNCYFYS